MLDTWTAQWGGQTPLNSGQHGHLYTAAPLPCISSPPSRHSSHPSSANLLSFSPHNNPVRLPRWYYPVLETTQWKPKDMNNWLVSLATGDGGPVALGRRGGQGGGFHCPLEPEAQTLSPPLPALKVLSLPVGGTCSLRSSAHTPLPSPGIITPASPLQVQSRGPTTLTQRRERVTCPERTLPLPEQVG